jgi:hypothetical protein
MFVESASFNFQKGLIEIQHNGLAELACGIPQAWYGAGLLSLWSKGRVGSIPTSRAKLLFPIKA